MKKIEENISQLVKASVEKLGYELYDVEYRKQGKDYYITIYIDSENGITLEDCEKTSNELDEILDKADLIKEQYFLEISSPGLERTIRTDEHLQKAIGKEIEITLYTKIDNKKQYIGVLKAYNENSITIQNEEEKEIDRKNISNIKQIYKWD